MINKNIRLPERYIKFIREIGRNTAKDIAYILCVINHFSTKSVFATLFIHRLFFIIDRVYKIENFNIDFIYKENIGHYSRRLKYLLNMAEDYGLVDKMYMSIFDSESCEYKKVPQYYVTNYGKLFYTYLLSRNTIKKVMRIARKVNYVNYMMPREQYLFYMKMVELIKLFDAVKKVIDNIKKNYNDKSKHIILTPYRKIFIE